MGENCPSDEGVQLNTTGSSQGNPVQAGAGGLIRDRGGTWCIGFSSNLGVRSNMFAELWAIRQGLTLAWDAGYPRVIVETDSLEAVRLVDDNFMVRTHRALVHDIRFLIARDWECKIQHVLREANQCADHLAKLGATQLETQIIWQNPPPSNYFLLLADSASICFLRS